MNFRKYFPLIISVSVATILTLYTIFSGQGSFEMNLQKLQQNPDKVQKVTSNTETSSSGNQKSIVVTCKNGEKYEIVYREGQTNFDHLLYDKCGEEGVESESNVENNPATDTNPKTPPGITE